LILENGVIRTLDPSLPTARALAIAGERIAGGVGVHETALASPETVDLHGRCVLPGFTDSHVHFPTWAMTQREVKLDGAASLAEALQRIREGGLRRGYGWREADWADGAPTRHQLDELSSEPMAFFSKDYHSLWLNSAALALAGGDLEVEGGVVERDEQGEPTGILREEAAWRFKDRHLQYAPQDFVDAMRDGMKLANSRGVTCLNDKDGWLGAIGLWQRLDAQTPLTLRVWQSTPAENVAQLGELGVRSGVGSPMLRLGYLKAFMDGTLGSRTAWMLDGSGVVITSGEQLAEIVRAGAAAGWPVGVHAIGDRANREALDAFEQTRDVWQPLGLRQRIEHAQCVAPEDLARFAALGVAVSAQFTHAPSDEELAKRFWPDKLERAYSFRSLLDSGALVANGSDAPVEELDPWAGVVAGVERHWRDDQRLTLDQALHATCVAPTWLSHDERVRGTLVPGRYADLVVLDRDPFESELREVQVVATMVAGKWVHNPPPWD
jgi:predicted amidohydrolase YtcJ